MYTYIEFIEFIKCFYVITYVIKPERSKRTVNVNLQNHFNETCTFIVFCIVVCESLKCMKVLSICHNHLNLVHN